MREGGRPIDIETPPRPIGPGASFEMRAQDLRPVVRDYARNLRRQLFELARAYGLKNPNDFSEEFAEGRVPGNDMDRVVDLVKKMTACFEKNKLPREAVREQEGWMEMAKRLATTAAAEMVALPQQLQPSVMETLAPALVWTGDPAVARGLTLIHSHGSKASWLAFVRALVMRGNRAEAAAINIVGHVSLDEYAMAAGTAAVDAGDVETACATMGMLNRGRDHDAQKKLTEYVLTELLHKGSFSNAERFIAATLQTDIREQSWITMAWHARLSGRPVESYLDRAIKSYDPGRTTVQGIRRLVAAFAENGRGDDPAIRATLDWVQPEEKTRLRMIVAYRSGNVAEGRHLQWGMNGRYEESKEDQIEELRAYLRTGKWLRGEDALFLIFQSHGRSEDPAVMLRLLSDLTREERAANRDTSVCQRALDSFRHSHFLDQAVQFQILTEIICLETELGLPTKGESFERLVKLCQPHGIRDSWFPTVSRMHRAGVDVSRVVRMEEEKMNRVSAHTQPFVWYSLAALQVRCGMDPTESIRHAESVPADIQRQFDVRAKADLAAALSERAFGILKGNES